MCDSNELKLVIFAKILDFIKRIITFVSKVNLIKYFIFQLDIYVTRNAKETYDKRYGCTNYMNTINNE
jgi:hypothetical protein